MSTLNQATIKSSRWLEWLALAAIITLAAVLRFANLSALGDANHYYTAAVQAMSQSWHNFFFAAAEPGGAVSVDKPPVGLWFQVASAYVFGVNGFGVLLPQIIAGIFSVALIYYLVRKKFGALAGLVAGLALAITPVTVATDRNNTMDSTLILVLLLATWAFIVAVERGQARYLILGSILVGIGFNIKMLQAYLPVPAFIAFYFLGSPEHVWRKFANLALAGIVLLAVSFSWAIAVDLTPADQRPFVGSSGNNSVMSLITGYNGTQRLLGMGGRGNLLATLFGGNQNSSRPVDAPGQPPQGFQTQPDRQPPQTFQQRDDRQPPQGMNVPQGAPPDDGPGGGGGMFNTGQPGAARLFNTPLSKETSWLLPFGLFSMVLLLFRSRLQWALSTRHQAVVLWGGWLVTVGIFFSVAGFFHEYYLVMLAPALAALVGIGVAELWQMREKHAWLALGLFIVASLATLYVQFTTANAYVKNAWWWSIVVALSLAGIVMWIPGLTRRFKFIAPIGLACLLGALMLTPGIWSGLTVFNASGNQSLPAAYDGRSSGPANRGGTQTNHTLLNFLQTNTQGIKYLVAVPSSMQGADYVLATGRPVLYLGGFNGQDRVVTLDKLAQMVANNELRYIYYDVRGGGGPNGGQPDIANWVAQSCARVGYDTAASNFGAPDGTPNTNNNDRTNGMQVTLYDCKAK